MKTEDISWGVRKQFAITQMNTAFLLAEMNDRDLKLVAKNLIISTLMLAFEEVGIAKTDILERLLGIEGNVASSNTERVARCEAAAPRAEMAAAHPAFSTDPESVRRYHLAEELVTGREHVRLVALVTYLLKAAGK